MKMTFEVEELGIKEEFEVTEQERDGILKYMDRHPRIDGITCARVYLMNLRHIGIDPNDLPLPQRSPEQLGL